MRSSTRGGLGAVLALLVGWLPLSGPASAATGTAWIIHDHPESACAGDAATLAWTPPEGLSDVVGYQIAPMNVTDAGVRMPAPTTVGREQTRLDFPVPYGLTSYLIRAVTSSGVAQDPFTSATIFGSREPWPMHWLGFPGPVGVGDGTATVTFAWAGPIQWHTTGGVIADTLQVTAAPGGATATSPAPTNTTGVTTTFTGLTNGVAYTFTGVTSNACGSSGPSTSAVYVPGVRPTWLQASPPLTVKKSKAYGSQFAASGTPAPTYQLVGAPTWLAVSPSGLVSGDPPKDTTSFSYSIVADNGVGVQYPGLQPPVVAGPFTVAVVHGQG